MAGGCCAAAPGRCGNQLSLIPCLSLGVQSKGVPEFPVWCPRISQPINATRHYPSVAGSECPEVDAVALLQSFGEAGKAIVAKCPDRARGLLGQFP